MTAMMTADKILEMNRPMKERLFDFPGEIRRQKEKVETARQSLKDAQAQVNEIEAEMIALIAAEKDPDTRKPAFSNAEARAAELVRRKAGEPTFKAASLALRAAEEDVNAAQFDLERLHDEFRAYRYVVDLTARELALLCVDQHSESRPAAEPY